MQLFLIVCFVVIPTVIWFSIQSWRKTPHGLLDTRTAIALKFLKDLDADQGVEKERANMLETTQKAYKRVEVAKVENQRISLDDREVNIRYYHPKPDTQLPVLVYFHGGGWVLGNLDTHDGICRHLANRGEVLVISVDYRLAPEYPFPAAIEDCYDAVLWIIEHAAELGGIPEKLAVGGDSAGGNLAAAVSLKARDKQSANILFQGLIYPVTDASTIETRSYNKFQTGFLLTKDRMEKFIHSYLPDKKDRTHAYASPLHAENLSNLPPALVITAGFDPLRDEGTAYAKKMEAAGVSVTLSEYKTTIHGFFGIHGIGKVAYAAVDEFVHEMRKYL